MHAHVLTPTQFTQNNKKRREEAKATPTPEKTKKKTINFLALLVFPHSSFQFDFEWFVNSIHHARKPIHLYIRQYQYTRSNSFECICIQHTYTCRCEYSHQFLFKIINIFVSFCNFHTKSSFSNDV